MILLSVAWTLVFFLVSDFIDTAYNLQDLRND